MANPQNEPVDLRREHHWFSYKQGLRDGRSYGLNNLPSAFKESFQGFPMKVSTNPGYADIDVVPPAYQKGFEEGYPKGVAEREELEAKIAREHPDLVRTPPPTGQ